MLYKDARCDMNILDETVGPENWQRKHSRDNANCTVGIWDEGKGQWIEKEDTGTESRTEREKGLASDSFKRACFNWGIGRELYTAPFIWIPAAQCRIENVGGKVTCYDRFSVEAIEYSDGVISGLEIVNAKTHKPVYTYGATKAEPSGTASSEKPGTVTRNMISVLTRELQRVGRNTAWLLGRVKGAQRIEDITVEQFNYLMDGMRQMPTEAAS